MPLRSRLGTLLLLIGGLGLVAWMAFTLISTGGDSGSDRRRTGVVEVAVFLPDRTDWADVRGGVEACVNRGLIFDVVEGPESISFRTADQGREVRLSWFEGGGVVTTRDRVNRLLDRPSPPQAFVGSNNTVLTAALAEALNSGADRRRGKTPDPVLLVPWATSVRVDRPGAASVRLLDLYPGRTFRFCPNNRQEAELVSRVVAEKAGEPGGAVMVIDGNDPYSRDLADGFDRAIGEVAPGAKVVIRRLDLSSPGHIGTNDRPGPAELDEADRIWRFVADREGDGPVWAVLPLQGNPTRRMIRALVDRAGPIGPKTLNRLQILCGDGIGRTTLSDLVGRCTLPIWCASSDSLPGVDSGSEAMGASQIPAEIVAALSRVLDRLDDPDDLAPALSSVSWTADDPRSFGRSLSFDPSGERSAGDLGHVLAILPGQPEILAFAPPGRDDLGGDLRPSPSLAGDAPSRSRSTR